LTCATVLLTTAILPMKVNCPSGRTTTVRVRASSPNGNVESLRAERWSSATYHFQRGRVHRFLMFDLFRLFRLGNGRFRLRNSSGSDGRVLNNRLLDFCGNSLLCLLDNGRFESQ
jgi:hypothetical protein